MDTEKRQLPAYPFVGIPSFLRAPIRTDLARLDADIAIVGVPTDEGSPFLPGSRLGPRGIREHSLRSVPTASTTSATIANTSSRSSRLG